jgi:protein-disulfide isomerase
MKAKEIGIWIGIIVVLIGGLWLLISAVNNSASPTTPIIKDLPPVSKTDFTRGNANAKATLIEYADFQCPGCALINPFITQLQEDFKNDLREVFRFFPLANIHQNSMISAQAVYSAGLQNKFWEMHDIIFENQATWSNDANAEKIFTGYAKKLGLNLAKFESDITSESTKQFITDELNKGIALGINSTPSFFLNGKYIQTPTNYEEFKQIIQNAIQK